MKDHLLSITRGQVEDLAALQRLIKAVPTERIARRPPLDTGASTARQWFDAVRPALESAQFSKDVLESFSGRYDELLRVSSGKPMKGAYLHGSFRNLGSYRQQIVHQIEVGSFATTTGLSIAPYIEGLPVAEGDYLDEAQRCPSVQALRGCIVLGWCATVARIHEKIDQIGFAKFSKATEEMSAKTTGRFKPYNKKFVVESRSDLQRVFDTELLWSWNIWNL